MVRKPAKSTLGPEWYRPARAAADALADYDGMMPAPEREDDAEIEHGAIGSAPDRESGVEMVEPGSPEDDRVAELLTIEAEAPELAEAVEQQEAPDAADTLETLPEEEAAEVIELMDERAAAEAISHMRPPLAVGVIEDLIDEDVAFAARLFGLMAPDDAADFLQALDEKHRSALLAVMAPEPKQDLVELIRYDEESAGGLMTTDYLALREVMTVEEAIAHIRQSEIREDVLTALVTNDKNQLVGRVSLRRLLTTRPHERIADIMEQTVEAIRPDLDREAVAREFDRYDYDMLPVVDADDRLLGIVTVDDVIDIIRAEHTEDTQKLVGASAGEAVYSRLDVKFRGRLPWMLVNLVTTFIGAMVVLRFEPLIEQLAILAVLMPMIAASAGNAGQQSLAVTLRGIVLEEVRAGRVIPLVLREAAVGLLIGLILGVIVGAAMSLLAVFVDSASWRLGAIAGVSLAVSMTIGTLAGSSIPLVMRRFGIDPATASAIFLIMVTDSVSFATFLGCAHLLSGWLLAP
jgi:magnesium transporter